MYSKSKLIILPLISVSIGAPVALVAHDRYKYNSILKRSIDVAKNNGMKISEDSKVPKILILSSGDEAAENDMSLFKKTYSKLLTYSGIDYNLVKIEKGKNIDEFISSQPFDSSAKEKVPESGKLESFKNVLLLGNFQPNFISLAFANQRKINFYNIKYIPSWFNNRAKLLEDVEGLFHFIDRIDHAFS
jgi:hypothetical protein